MKGPQGQKRPGDVVGGAVTVAKLATGEMEEGEMDTQKAARILGRSGALKRSQILPPERRSEIAKIAGRCAVEGPHQKGHSTDLSSLNWVAPPAGLEPTSPPPSKARSVH